MFKDMEFFKIENIHAGTAKKFGKVTSRKSSSFIIRVGGGTCYTFDKMTFDIQPGDIIFLPKGSNYEVESVSDTACQYIAIRVDTDDCNCNPFVYSIGDFPEYDEIINNLADMWSFGGLADKCRCYSVVYNLLAFMKNTEINRKYEKKKIFNIISPAVLYLRTHICDCGLKIEHLSKLCGISDAYFHKIFHSKYSMSPKNYILQKRLSRAKSIFDSGDYDTVSEVSALVGYTDPLYFSRAFKKKYGLSPTDYIKQL